MIEGWITLHRKLLRSPVWRSLTEGQRCAFVAMLLLANYSPTKARWRDKWYPVGRGELSHSLETIADEACVSVKVVRSTIAALISDGTMIEKYPILGTGPGTGPRALTFVNYSQYQDTSPQEGTDMGTGRARVGQREKQENKKNKLPFRKGLKAVPVDPFPTNPPPSKPLDEIEREYLDSPERLAWLASQNGGTQ